MTRDSARPRFPPGLLGLENQRRGPLGARLRGASFEVGLLLPDRRGFEDLPLERVADWPRRALCAVGLRPDGAPCLPVPLKRSVAGEAERLDWAAGEDSRGVLSLGFDGRWGRF